jgi:hypothetical protein
MKTFQEFLEESALARLALRGIRSASRVARTADGGRTVTSASRVARTADGGRRVTSAARATRNVRSRVVPPRGPGENTWDRIDARRSISDKAVLKKAGFKRSQSGEQPKETEAWASPHHSTMVRTYKNQSDYVIDQVPHKNLSSGRSTRKVRSTASIVRHAKALRKQLGGDRTSKPVHDVAILSDRAYAKNDPEDLISRGRSFRKEVGAVPSALWKAGANPGDKVTSEPSGIMSGEDIIKGKEKRDKIYTKVLKAKMNPKTGKTMGTYRHMDNN